jgi:hypothetical protein
MSVMYPSRLTLKTNLRGVPFTKIPGRGKPVVVRNRDGKNDAIGAQVATST